jgi:hypothetical protein
MECGWGGGGGVSKGEEGMREKKKKPTARCKILIPTKLTNIVM